MTLPELEESPSGVGVMARQSRFRDGLVLDVSAVKSRTVRPHVLVVYRGGETGGHSGRSDDLGHISCRLGYLRLNLPAKILCFVHGALRGNPSKENCDLIVSAVMQSLSAGEADAAYMSFLREDSELCRLGGAEARRC